MLQLLYISPEHFAPPEPTAESSAAQQRLQEQEAQQAFALLVEVNAEVQGLNKRLSVLQAAGVQFNALVQNALKEEAIIETKEVKEEED